MEKYKETIRKRMIGYACMMSGLGATTIFLSRYLPEETGSHILDFASGMVMGMLAALEILFVIMVVKMLIALENEEKLRAMYIDETDERSKLIYEKIGGNYAQVQSIAQLIISVGIIFLGLYEAGVVLFAITLVELLARIGMKFYYHKTM